MNSHSLILNLDNQAAALENDIHEFLLPYPAGIYMAGRENPVLKPAGHYQKFAKDEKGKLVSIPITCFEDITDSIYDMDGAIMISREVARDKKRMLLTRPSVPIYGRRLLAAYLKDHITRMALYVHSIRPTFLPTEYDLVCSQSLDYDRFKTLVVENGAILRDMMYEFIGGSSWNIYSTKRDGNQFTITNDGDWRIFDWERIQRERENTEKEADEFRNAIDEITETDNYPGKRR